MPPLGLLLDGESQLPYPGLCLPYPFTCTPRAVLVYRKDRKERVDTDGRRHTHSQPPPGVPGGATAPARAVAHNSGTCLPRLPGSGYPLCRQPRALIPLRVISPVTLGPPRRVARDRSPNTRSLCEISSHTSFVYVFRILTHRIRPLYTSFVYFFLHSIRHTLYLTALHLTAYVLCIRRSYTFFFCNLYVMRVDFSALPCPF